VKFVQRLQILRPLRPLLRRHDVIERGDMNDNAAMVAKCDGALDELLVWLVDASRVGNVPQDVERAASVSHVEISISVRKSSCTSALDASIVSGST
jgi:hypothetical protein